MKNGIQRGDIVVVNFEPVRGSEQRGVRPALVVQNNISNEHSPTTIIVPITSKKNFKTYVTNVPISRKESELTIDSLILCNQIRTIDKSGISKKISSLDKEIMSKVDLAIKISLNLLN